MKERTTRDLPLLGHPYLGFRVLRPFSLYDDFSYAKLPNVVTRQEQENQDSTSVDMTSSY
jgi:hypothetical protein